MNRALQKRLGVAILSAALLIAQHGALAHALSHLADEQQPGNKKPLLHFKLCDRCASTEKLSHCVPAAEHAAHSLRGSLVGPSEDCTSPDSLQARGYDSRAPPHLLPKP